MPLLVVGCGWCVCVTVPFSAELCTEPKATRRVKLLPVAVRLPLLTVAPVTGYVILNQFVNLLASLYKVVVKLVPPTSVTKAALYTPRIVESAVAVHDVTVADVGMVTVKVLLAAETSAISSI